MTKYDVLQKKMGRDNSIDFWRQWVTRPCILLLLNSIWSILYWVQYCIRHVLCSDYTQFWLYTPCQEPNNYVEHNINVLALAHGSLVWCNRAQTFICMVQLNGLAFLLCIQVLYLNYKLESSQLEFFMVLLSIPNQMLEWYCIISYKTFPLTSFLVTVPFSAT